MDDTDAWHTYDSYGIRMIPTQLVLPGLLGILLDILIRILLLLLPVSGRCHGRASSSSFLPPFFLSQLLKLILATQAMKYCGMGGEDGSNRFPGFNALDVLSLSSSRLGM